MDEVEHRRRRVRGAKGDGSRVDTSPAGDPAANSDDVPARRFDDAVAVSPTPERPAVEYTAASGISRAAAGPTRTGGASRRDGSAGTGPNRASSATGGSAPGGSAPGGSVPGGATSGGQSHRGASPAGNAGHSTGAPAHEGHRTTSTPAHDAHRSTGRGAQGGHDGGGHDDRENERGLRGLVGGGSTQVSVRAAMRARDAARPTAADIAEAEAHLTIVHRGWTPRDPA